MAIVQRQCDTTLYKRFADGAVGPTVQVAGRYLLVSGSVTDL